MLFQQIISSSSHQTMPESVSAVCQSIQHKLSFSPLLVSHDVMDSSLTWQKTTSAPQQSVGQTIHHVEGRDLEK